MQWKGQCASPEHRPPEAVHALALFFGVLMTKPGLACWNTRAMLRRTQPTS